jgi:predicted DNA-binding transcriptional regulator YafY
MRADRLVAIVLLLQARGQLTAGELAGLLETSERTIRRDLDALLMAGVPLYSLRGRNGGWALLGGHRLDLTGFTVEEAQALFLVAGSPASAVSGVEPGLRSALRKVFAALPESLRSHAAAATRATVFDPLGWGRAAEEPPLLDDVRSAVLQRVQVDIDYAKRGAPPEPRRVQPYGLIAKGGVWYLLAGTAHGRRTFRVSRVRAVRPTTLAVELPPSFDLAAEWASAQRDFLGALQVVRVHLRPAGLGGRRGGGRRIGGVAHHRHHGAEHPGRGGAPGVLRRRGAGEVATRVARGGPRDRRGAPRSQPSGVLSGGVPPWA